MKKWNKKTVAEKVSNTTEEQKPVERAQVGNSAEDFIDKIMKEKGVVRVDPEEVKQPYLKAGDYRITKNGHKVEYTWKLFEGHKVFKVYFASGKQAIAYKDEKLWFVELDVIEWDWTLYRKER